VHLRWVMPAFHKALALVVLNAACLHSKPHADRKGVVSTPCSMLSSLRSVCVCHASSNKEPVDERVLLLEASLPQGFVLPCQDNLSV